MPDGRHADPHTKGGTVTVGRVFGFFSVVSLIVSLFTGQTQAVCEAAVSGAASAVTVTLSLVGMTCLWSGVMRVFQSAGLVDRLATAASPLLSRLFPQAARSGGGGAIAAALIANLLGLGNAATPLTLSAMRHLASGAPSGTASDEMILFAVLSCAPPALFPTTVITLRAAAGAADPFDLLIPIWVCSLIGTAASVLICRIAARIAARRRDTA